MHNWIFLMNCPNEIVHLDSDCFFFFFLSGNICPLNLIFRAISLTLQFLGLFGIIFYSRNTCCVYWNASLHVIWFFWTYQSHLTAAVSQYNGKFHSTLKNHLRPKSELKWRCVWKNVSLKCQTNIASLWKNGVRSWDSWSAEAWLRVCVFDGWIDR